MISRKKMKRNIQITLYPSLLFFFAHAYCWEMEVSTAERKVHIRAMENTRTRTKLGFVIEMALLNQAAHTESKFKNPRS